MRHRVICLYAMSLFLNLLTAESRPVDGKSADTGRQYEIWEPAPAPNRGHVHGSKLKAGRAYPYDEDWERRSYPLGNGNLGANVFGRTDEERIQLTEKTIANGSVYD